MGLLAVLNLAPAKPAHRPVPGMIDVNVPTADPSAVERAERKARRRGGKQGEVLATAVRVVEVPDAISPAQADRFAEEAGDPKPVSDVAPRSQYKKLNARKHPKNDIYGSVENDLEIKPFLGEWSDGTPGIDFDVKAIIGKRYIVEESLGNGEIISSAKGVFHDKQQEGSIIAMPEQQVLEHEQLHVVVAARMAHAVQVFAKAAFGKSNLTQTKAERLRKLLDRIGDNAKDHANQRLHELITPGLGKNAVEKASAATHRLLSDGTVERLVRTALLDEVRLHSRALARFRT
jgi:hypothetical protein